MGQLYKPAWNHRVARVVTRTLVQVACPPPWMVAGFAGQFRERNAGGRMGRWATDRTPPLAHFVGAPDKIANMKLLGFWHSDADALAAWVDEAAAELRRSWGGEEDAAAAADPFEPVTAQRLQREGERVRAAVRPLQAFQDECAPSFTMFAAHTELYTARVESSYTYVCTPSCVPSDSVSIGEQPKRAGKQTAPHAAQGRGRQAHRIQGPQAAT